MTILKAHSLKKHYGEEPNLVRALDGVDIEIESGAFVAVVGTSGSGKTTLLHMLGGLDRPTQGRVTVGGHELCAMSDDELTVFRRRNVGFVFQHYNLVPILSAYENIALPIELDGNTPDAAFIDEILNALGLEDNARVYPARFPGGSSSAWQSPGRSRPNPPFSWPMNQRAIWTARRVRMYWAF